MDKINQKRSHLRIITSCAHLRGFQAGATSQTAKVGRREVLRFLSSGREIFKLQLHSGRGGGEHFSLSRNKT